MERLIQSLMLVEIVVSADNDVSQTLCSNTEMLQDFPLATASFFFTDANSQFPSCCQLDSTINLHCWVAVKEDIP